MTRRRVLWLVFAALLILNTALAIGWWQEGREKKLTVSFLDVGQGDAILIESPSGTDILIDGGRDRSVLRGLGRRMGPFDRSLDVVIATHPDADHIGGLSSVLENYRVGHYLHAGIESNTNVAEALEAGAAAEPGMDILEARRGMRLLFGGGVYADVLFPDRDVSLVETNTGSVIVRLVYGNTSFMLTGDAPASVEEWLVTLDGKTLKSDVLKAGHHGSRTSSSEAWLKAVDPDIVVISAGKDNSYGHPHEEVVQRILDSGAHIFSTVEDGTVTIVSDGVTVRKR